MVYGDIYDDLKTEAKVDYDRTKLFRNLSVAELYEHALTHEAGTVLSSTGAIVTKSGAKTGRSPKDKRIVEEPESTEDVWVIYKLIYIHIV